MGRLRHILPFAGCVVAAVLVQLVMRATKTEYCLTQLTMSIYYSMVGMALCLVMGYAGQVSLGHGAFFAMGGFTTAFLTTHDFMPLKDHSVVAALKNIGFLVSHEDMLGNQVLTSTPWIAFITAIVLVFIIAHLIGWPALRLKGQYLAMATLGFGLIIHKIILGTALLGATDGITNVPEWQLGFGLEVSGKKALRVQNFYIACGVLLVFLFLLQNLVRSRVGRALQAIHDRETAANAMGINTAVYKLKAFVASALLAAIAGIFLTHYTGGIGPSEAGAMKSVRYVALTAVGGMANLWGVALVSTVINFCSLRGWFGTLDNAVFGVLLILIISLAPDGPLKPMAKWLAAIGSKIFRGRKADHGLA